MPLQQRRVVKVAAHCQLRLVLLLLLLLTLMPAGAAPRRGRLQLCLEGNDLDPAMPAAIGSGRRLL